MLAVVLGLVLPVARFASRAHLSNQSLRTSADEQDQNRAELRKGAPESCEIAEAMHRLRVRAQPLPLSFGTASPLSLRSLLALTSPHKPWPLELGTMALSCTTDWLCTSRWMKTFPWTCPLRGPWTCPLRGPSTFPWPCPLTCPSSCSCPLSCSCPSNSKTCRSTVVVVVAAVVVVCTSSPPYPVWLQAAVVSSQIMSTGISLHVAWSRELRVQTEPTTI